MSDESPDLNPETEKLLRWFFGPDGHPSLLGSWLRGVVGATKTVTGLDAEDFVRDAMTALAEERHRHPERLYPYPRLRGPDLRPEPDFWAVFRNRRDRIRSRLRRARNQEADSLDEDQTDEAGEVLDAPVVTTGGPFPVYASARTAGLDPTADAATQEQARRAWLAAIDRVRARLCQEPICVTAEDRPACLAFLGDVSDAAKALSGFDATDIMPLTFEGPLDHAVALRFGGPLAFDSNARKQFRRLLHHAFWRAVCELELPRSRQLQPLPGHALLARAFGQPDPFMFVGSVHGKMMATKDGAFAEVHPRLTPRAGFHAHHLLATSRQTLWHGLVQEGDPTADVWPPSTDYVLWDPADLVGLRRQ